MSRFYPKYVRKQGAQIITELQKNPEHVIFLTGDRGVGKTTLVLQAREALGDSDGFEYFSAQGIRVRVSIYKGLPEKDISSYIKSQWSKAIEKSKQMEKPFIFVIDEVQDIPNWADFIRELWETNLSSDQRSHLVILGPTEELGKQEIETLLDISLRIDLNHWSCNEMSEAFGWNLEQFIFYGNYPFIADYVNNNDDEWWYRSMDNFVECGLYEVFSSFKENHEQRIFLEEFYHLGAHRHSRIMSYQEIIDIVYNKFKVTISKKEIKKYLEMMSRENVIAGLANLSLENQDLTKLQVYSSAFTSVKHGYTFSEAMDDSNYWQKLVKNAVGAHILNSKSENYSIYFWQNREYGVDFVVKGVSDLTAIHVAPEGKERLCQDLLEFQKEFPKAQVISIGAGGVSIDEFLSRPVKEWCEVAS